MLDVEQSMLSERFTELLEAERRAEQAYANCAADESDPEKRTQLEQICREKARHVELVRRLLEIVD